MAVRHGYGKIAGTDALVFAYDTGDTRNSYKGEPTVNYVPGSFGYNLYAYASGPVDTTVLNEKNQLITVKRYTITNAVSTARAAIYPTGLTTGVAYTLSFKWKYNGSTTISPLVLIDASKGNPEGGANNNSFTSQSTNTINIGSGWYLSTYTFVFSSIPTSACILTFGIVTGTTSTYIGETFDIYEAQFEIKDHKTQYSNGTRSSTQGLLDLTGRSTVDIANVSFDSNAQMTFDGTNDQFTLNDPNTGTTFSMEFIVKANEYSSNPILISPNSLGYDHFVRINDSGKVFARFAEVANSSTDSYVGTTTLALGKFYHVTVTKSPTNGTIYVNGVAEDSHIPTLPAAAWSGTWKIGARGNNTFWFNGELPVIKIYNRALTADEVRNNYSNYKTRFNL